LVNHQRLSHCLFSLLITHSIRLETELCLS
ncbi:hypothetical protein DFA_11469, partial [Cavenderia fasciculata]